MQKCVFDKNTVNKQLVLLSSLLEGQREIKKTLLSYLEKVSDYISSPTNIENSETLALCLSNVQEIFDNIKSNIDKLIELKVFIENISKSTSLNIIDFEKYYNQFTELSKKIENTNNSYNDFMEKLTSILSIDFSDLNHKKSENLNNSEAEPVIETVVEQPTTEETSIEEIVKENIPQTESVIETIVEESIEESSETFQEKSPLESVIPESEATVENSIEILEETSIEEIVEENISEPIIEDTATEKTSIEETIKKDIIETEPVVEENVEKSIEKTEENKTTTERVIEKNNSKINLAERTLLIDNEAQIAVLPYSLFDLEEYFSENPEKYSSIKDIIEKEYTVSLSNYENTSISRFKQTFKLAKERSNLSFFESLNYANKLLFENQVEPIIIASCNNIDELEVYLDCLNNDVLNSFKCFTIINK